MFLTEGQVNGQSVLDIFTQNISNRSQDDQALVESWKRTFNGLFMVLQAEGDRYEVMNFSLD
ncbi:hypothetical protein HPC62_12895 [Thermoleptolyngbya sichuanensis A183]|uniref:Uncharacterized protein n=1 Tax=Thermoleptolyngbya sichuanensis A183 TaxID=2737172 RepID=A0A6M8B6G5_9CYAN|nr:hypothetical protein [Thermoleptolyngbya sichuanensis]QKD82969.1 hypothetical protein HPC62_12895 [Thermoleptolyngbya sichuanensis A183]